MRGRDAARCAVFLAVIVPLTLAANLLDTIRPEVTR